MFVTTLIHVTFVDPKIRFYKYRTYALTDLMFYAIYYNTKHLWFVIDDFGAIFLRFNRQPNIPKPVIFPVKTYFVKFVNA